MLGNLRPIASLPGQIVVTHNEWYDFEAKYDEGEMELVVPAPIGEPQLERAQRLAVEAFVATDCEGMARADMFVRDDGEVLVNELNTIPGLHADERLRTSLRGVGDRYAELLQQLADLAVERFERRNGAALLEALARVHGADPRRLETPAELRDPDEPVAVLRRRADRERRRDAQYLLSSRRRRRGNGPPAESPALISAVKPGVGVTSAMRWRTLGVPASSTSPTPALFRLGASKYVSVDQEVDGLPSVASGTLESFSWPSPSGS